MNRKEKIALLNGILKGELPMASVFKEWPEKTFYELQDDENNFKTKDGKIVLLEEVDHELMNYPKVRIIYKEPIYKGPTDEERKSMAVHKYVNEHGEEVVIEEGSKEAALFLSKGRKDVTIPISSELSNPKADTNPDAKPPPDPKPPPEPFLSRKDREVMARDHCIVCAKSQGSGVRR